MTQKITDDLDNDIYSVQSVKRFYFLDYFFILLDSINRHHKSSDAFLSFLELKKRYRLGESKYKKLTVEKEDFTDKKISRYLYTFGQVIDEAIEYGLVQEKEDVFHLTQKGTELLGIHEDKGALSFNEYLCRLMEAKYGAFRYVISKLYTANKKTPGLLILPSYSAMDLGRRSRLHRCSDDIYDYSLALVDRLKKDINEYIGEKRGLEQENEKIFKRLIRVGLLPEDGKGRFDPSKYNVISKRFRDFWMTYFLKEIYGYKYSISSFDIWTYRGKQIGIIHATEFHPYFDGKIVYPLSVVVKGTQSQDFTELFSYGDGFKLYVHRPRWEEKENQERFVDCLAKAYFDVRRRSRSYFVNLLAIREIVCSSMKISEGLFEDFLNTTYKLNLAGKLKIRISLEVDKLPEETGVIYLRQEPIMVDKKYRNIIAIDVSKGE